jgi:hypothetical protein
MARVSNWLSLPTLQRGIAMLVVTHWRPMPIGQPPPFEAITNEVQSLKLAQGKKLRKIKELLAAEMYYNEVGHEIVSLDRVKNFAALDVIEGDKLNTEIGLRLMRMGYGVATVDYLRELDGLAMLRKAYRELPE